MIQNNQELEVTLERIERFQKQIAKLKKFETNPRNYELSAGGFLAEIDRMNLEVSEYLLIHLSKLEKVITEADRIKADGVFCNPSVWRGWGLSSQEEHV